MPIDNTDLLDMIDNQLKKINEKKLLYMFLIKELELSLEDLVDLKNRLMYKGE
jgi:hypothetical protein